MSRDRQRRLGQTAAFLAVFAALVGCARLQRFLIPPQMTPETNRTDTKVADVAADLIVVAGHVHGHDGPRAVAVRGSVVAAVALAGEVTPLRVATTQLVKVPAGYVTPGLVDAHVHLEGAAMLGDAADLSGVTTLPELGKAMAATVATGGDWQWGFGLGLAAFEKFNAADVEQACPDLAVYLSRSDGHAALVSQALVKWLPPDLQREVMQAKYKVQGELARHVWRLLPPQRTERLGPMVRVVLEKMQQQGVTEVHAMGESMALVTALLQLEREGRLPLRVKVYLDTDRPEAGDLIEGRAKRIHTQLLDVAGIKLWLDGTLGSGSAALLQPYDDRPSNGLLRYGDGELLARIADADKRGLQVAVHAIGDAAVAQVARVLRKLVRPGQSLPVRIEHAQVVPPEVREALWGLPVECSVQPRHAAADAAFARTRLGAERLNWAYPGLALVAQCPVRAGSDLPVAVSDPMGDWRVMAATDPAQLGADATRGTVEELALAALTPKGTKGRDAAVRPGDTADLVVWDHDPRLPGPPAKVLWSIVGGSAQQVIGR